MSNIRYDMGTDLAVYGDVLQRTIDAVLEKIGISDEGIEWVVFKEEKFLNTWGLPVNPSFVYIYEKNYKYGFCYIDKQEIWISTAALKKAPNIIERMLPRKKEENLLVNVILDELAHIVTGEDHGDTKYDKTLASFYKKYYGLNTCIAKI